MLQSITRPSAVDGCADALRASVFRGEFSVGERLPPERRLATIFGVGRVTIRSALGRLAEEGLLNVRQGRGYEVCDFERVSGPQVLPALIAHARVEGELPEVMAELLEVRRELARLVMRRIAERDADTDAIRSAVHGFVRCAMASVTEVEDTTHPNKVHPIDDANHASVRRELMTLDLAIVQALLDAAGSRVLRLALNPFLTIVEELPELRDVMYRDPSANARGYQALLGWLDAPAAERAVALPQVVALLHARDQLTLAQL